jgi:hypothetical protein
MTTEWKSFEDELTDLINRHSMENESNTPDFILARYMQGCLTNFNAAVKFREQWYGRDGHTPEFLQMEEQSDNPLKRMARDSDGMRRLVEDVVNRTQNNG